MFENPPGEHGEEVEEFVRHENPTAIDEDYPEETNKIFLTMRILILAILVAFLFGYVVVQEDTVGETGGAAAGIEPPCFKDNVVVDKDTSVVNSCVDIGGVECPDGGTCKLGKLVECIEDHYEISENKDNCVLTSERKEKVVAIQAVLEEMTLKKGGCYISVDEYPMFPFREVQLANPRVIAFDTLKLSILRNEFIEKRVNGILLIGLKSDYKLNTGMYCKGISAVVYFFEIFKALIASFRFLLSMVFSTVPRQMPNPKS